MNKSNSEANGRTDSLFPFAPDAIIMWAAALAARGSLKQDKAFVTFKYESANDLFNEERTSLIAWLDSISKDIGVEAKEKFKRYDLFLDEASDGIFRKLFKFWFLGDRYIPAISALVYGEHDGIHSFLYTYGMLRGISYEKYIKSETIIKVTKVYGNLKMLRAYNEMLYIHQVLNGIERPYIPRIHKGTRKDYHIELGPSLSVSIFGE